MACLHNISTNRRTGERRGGKSSIRSLLLNIHTGTLDKVVVVVVFPHNFARHLIPTSCNSCIGMNVTNGLRLVLTNAHTTVIIYSWHRKVSSKNGIMVHNLVRKRALWFSVSSLCVNNMVRLWFIHNASIIATNVVKILLSIASPLCLWWWRSHKAMAMVVVVVIRKLWMCLHYHHFTSIRTHYTALFYSLSRFTINLCAICFWESDAADTQLTILLPFNKEKQEKRGNFGRWLYKRLKLWHWTLLLYTHFSMQRADFLPYTTQPSPPPHFHYNSRVLIYESMCVVCSVPCMYYGRFFFLRMKKWRIDIKEKKDRPFCYWCVLCCCSF